MATPLCLTPASPAPSDRPASDVAERFAADAAYEAVPSAAGPDGQPADLRIVLIR
jgi:hypothetical protein